MSLEKFFRNLSFVVLVGLNANQLEANPGIDTTSSFAYSFSQQKTYLELKEKDSAFSLRIVDKDRDSKAGLIRLINEEKDMVFIRHDFEAKDSIKEAQLFDIADKFLKDFSNIKKPNAEQNEQYKNYFDLVQKRFFSDNQPKQRVNYNFNKFFSGGFKPQDTIEDLVMYSYVKYSGLIREAKVVNPEQTFQNLIDSSSWWDQLRFWFLIRDYEKNLDKLGYEFAKEPLVQEDYFEVDLFKKVSENALPYIKIEVNTNSIPSSVDTAEIKDFLKGKDKSFFKYDKKGNYLYGGFKCEK